MGNCRRTYRTGRDPDGSRQAGTVGRNRCCRFHIRYAFDYHVDNTAAKPGDHAAGQVFLAEIHTLGEIPESEMAETSLWDTHPPTESLTYPAILPVLFREIQSHL